MLIVKTPYRFSIFGGGLDYPEWYLNHPTKVLCAGLDYYCYQTVRRLPPFFLHKHRAAYSKIELVNTFEEFAHPSIREILKKYASDMGVEITHVGDLPARSGIGSSSSFSVGLILAIHALHGKYLSRTNLARMAIEIEQNVMNENVGFQDQCASAFGGLVFIDTCGSEITPRRYVCQSDYIRYFEESILLGFDGIPRNSGDSSRITKKKIASNTMEPMLQELASITESGINAFGDCSDLSVLADLTKQSRDIKLRLNNQATDLRSIELIETTERAGSMCTRIMGAGGGGFFVCMAPQYRHISIKNSLPSIKIWANLRFSPTGSQVIHYENESF